MKPWNFELDHIGVAVSNLEETAKVYELLGLKEKSRESVASEGVNVSFFPLQNGSDIELLEPQFEDSVIGKFVNKKGPGVHHICLRTQNLDELVEVLKKKGVRFTSPKPRLGAQNCKVIFIHPKFTGGVLIELSEKLNGDLNK